MQNRIRIIVRLIAMITLIVTAVSYYNEHTFEPRLALLISICALLDIALSSPRKTLG
ncbi:MAG: hypothetical protein ACPGWR_17880 [Ardenticatenaceae bacterium]